MNNLVSTIAQQLLQKLLCRQLIIEAIKRHHEPDLAVSDLDPGTVVQLMLINDRHQSPAKESRATLSSSAVNKREEYASWLDSQLIQIKRFLRSSRQTNFQNDQLPCQTKKGNQYRLV